MGRLRGGEILPTLIRNPKLVSVRLDGMKTTLDIPENELEEAIRHAAPRRSARRSSSPYPNSTGARRLQKLAEKFGTLDGFMTQDDLRRMREEP